MGTAAVMAIYGFSRRLYDSAVGLGSAAVFAVLGPAVMASRIATRDAGAFFFFAVGLWALCGPGRKMKFPSWLVSATCLFGAFLCKYVVAIYFPFLVIIALRKGWRAALSLCLPMTAASAFTFSILARSQVPTAVWGQIWFLTCSRLATVECVRLAATRSVGDRRTIAAVLCGSAGRERSPHCCGWVLLSAWPSSGSPSGFRFLEARSLRTAVPRATRCLCTDGSGKTPRRDATSPCGDRDFGSPYLTGGLAWAGKSLHMTRPYFGLTSSPSFPTSRGGCRTTPGFSQMTVFCATTSTTAVAVEDHRSLRILVPRKHRSLRLQQSGRGWLVRLRDPRRWNWRRS